MIISKHNSFLPSIYHYELLRTLQSSEFPWYYYRDATNIIDTGSPDSIDDYKKAWNTRSTELLEGSGAKSTFGMAHVFFSPGQVPSSYWNLLRPMMYFIEDALGVKCMEKIIRCKASLLFNDGGKDTFNAPHVDHTDESNYINVLYYLNESDGDTVFFNEYFNGDLPVVLPVTGSLKDLSPSSLKSVTVKERSSPIENCLVVFDGHQYHASSNPINFQDRITLNWTIKTE